MIIFYIIFVMIHSRKLWIWSSNNIIIAAKHLYLHHLLIDGKQCMYLQKSLLFDEIWHRWSLEKHLRCLCNLSHLTACDWISQDVNTRCKQGQRDLRGLCFLFLVLFSWVLCDQYRHASMLTDHPEFPHVPSHSFSAEDKRGKKPMLWMSLAQNPTSIPWLMTLPILLISLCLCQESSELKTIINSAKTNRSTVRSLHTCTHQPGV